MAVIVILILAVLWAAVLLPPVLRARAGGSVGGGGFGTALGALAKGRPSDPGAMPLQTLLGPVEPTQTLGSRPLKGAMSPIQRRRRDVLIGLLGLAALTFMMAFVASSIVFWVLHLLADGLVAAYVLMLLRIKAREQERRRKVRPILAEPPPRHLHAVPDQAAFGTPYGLRRTASY